ncbi:MAG: AI-2E family transporter [Gemmataceae bacterium]
MDDKHSHDSSSSAEPLRLPERSRFLYQLTCATLGLLFVVLVIHLLEKFASVLQPLLIAVFIAYVIVPIHHQLVARRVPSLVAYVLIVTVIIGVFLGVSQQVYSNVTSLTVEQLDQYEQRLGNLVRRGVGMFSGAMTVPDDWRFRNLFVVNASSREKLAETLRSVVGVSLGLLTMGFVVAIYLIFLIGEMVSLPRRIRLAYGDARGNHIMNIVGTINRAIADYISVKMYVSFLTGFLSLVVLAVFGVEFFVTWSILIFLFNFIPYIGSLVAVSLPILFSFVQFDDLWKPVTITVLLVAVQQGTGNFLEPRLTGSKLGVSPLMILLSLAFWGLLWGIVGMILAVPLTVIAKIILENIAETKPIARLISND